MPGIDLTRIDARHKLATDNEICAYLGVTFDEWDEIPYPDQFDIRVMMDRM